MGKLVVGFVSLLSIVTFLVFGLPLLKGKESIEAKAMECQEIIDKKEQQACFNELWEAGRREGAKVQVLTTIIEGEAEREPPKAQD